MYRRMILAALVVEMSCFLAQAADSPSATAPATQAALKAIRYQRTGGFAGTNDVIEITPDGAVAVQGKLMGKGKGQLTAEQIAKLLPVFADWPAAAKSYPAPAGSADGFEIKIRYGTVEIGGSELAANLPADFKAARAALEQIAQVFKGK